MIKNFFNIFCLIFTIIFFYFVISEYLSGKNIKLINQNRDNINDLITGQSKDLKFFKNDTNNIIEYNSGYNNENKKPLRNFWKLFKNQ